MLFVPIEGFSWIKSSISAGLIAAISFLMRVSQTNPAPLIVSILLFFSADAHIAISVANTCMCIATFPMLILDIFRHKKYDPRFPLLQWDLLILFQSFSLLGALLGAVCNTIFPSWALSIVVCFLLVFVIGKRIFNIFVIKSTIDEDRALLRQDQLLTAPRSAGHDTIIKHTRRASGYRNYTLNNKTGRHNPQPENVSVTDKTSRYNKPYVCTLGAANVQATDIYGDSTAETGVRANDSSLTITESLEHSKLVEQLLEGHSVSACESMHFNFTASSDSSSSDTMVMNSTIWRKKVLHKPINKDVHQKLSMTSRRKPKVPAKLPLHPAGAESKIKGASSSTPLVSEHQDKASWTNAAYTPSSDAHRDNYNSESEIKEMVAHFPENINVQCKPAHSHYPSELTWEVRVFTCSKPSLSEQSETASKYVDISSSNERKLARGAQNTPCEKQDRQNYNLSDIYNPLSGIPKAISLTDKRTIHGFGALHFKAIDPLRTIIFWLLEVLVLGSLGAAAYYNKGVNPGCSWIILPCFIVACVLSFVQTAVQMGILRLRIMSFYTLVNESLLTTSTDEHILKYKLTCGTLQPASLINIQSHVKIAVFSFLSGLVGSIVGYGSDLVIGGLLDKLQMQRRTYVSLQFAHIFFTSLYALLMELIFETICLPSTTLYIIMVFAASIVGHVLCDRLMEKLSPKNVYIIHILHVVVYIATFLTLLTYLVIFLVSSISKKHVNGIEPLCLISRPYCPIPQN